MSEKSVEGEKSVEEILAAIQRNYPVDTENAFKLRDQLFYRFNETPITKNTAVTYEGGKPFGHHIDEDDNYWKAPLEKQKGFDYQSESPLLGIALESDGQKAPASDRFLDPGISTEERVKSLQELVYRNDAESSELVLRALCDDEPDSDMIPYLVIACEQLRFEKQEDQAMLWKMLLRVALNYRICNEPFAERTTWSAVRRCASLIPVAEIDQLLPLLEFKGAVDCKLVTLQGLKSIFEIQFASFCGTEAIAKRVFELADSYTNRDILLPGESSAIANAAISFLATVGHPRLGELMDKVIYLDMRWFSKIVLRALKTILNQSDEGDHPTFVLIQSTVSNLESKLVE